jgi:hypothetical protein
VNRSVAPTVRGRHRLAALSLVVVLALVSAAAAQPPTTALSELLKRQDRFEGTRVTVRGNISNLNERSSFGRRTYTFDLEDGQQSVRVFASGSPPCHEGPVLVDGTFQKQKTQWFIVAAKVTCRRSESE